MPVVFTEHDHKYTNPVGEQYISSTTIVGKYKQPFDPHKITYGGKSLVQNYAIKHGGSVEYWLEKWNQNRDIACERGTAFHKAKEDYIQGRGVVVFKNQVTFVKNASFVIESYGDLSLLEDGLYTELLLWDDDWKLAGQADIVNIETINGIRYIDIDDYKTNGKINKVSYAPRGTNNHNMMLHPISHIMDCNLFHYELQLSIYGYMLERNGFVVRSLQFTHYPHEDELGLIPNPVVYPLEYRKKEVLSMLTHNRKEQHEQNRKAV